MTWVDLNSEWPLAIAGAAFATIGYYYRVWRESKDNQREALYLLAEIWHRSTLAFNAPIQKMFDKLSERLRELLPDANFTDEQEAAMRSYFTPILEKTIRFHAMDRLESLYGAYEKVVHLISRSDPIFAYDLDAASATKRRLAYIDQYLQEALMPLDDQGGAAKIFSDDLRNALKAEAEKEASQELEKHLRRLAFKLGIPTWMKINIRILRRRRLLTSGPDIDRFEKLLRDVLIPVVQKSGNGFQPTGQTSDHQANIAEKAN